MNKIINKIRSIKNLEFKIGVTSIIVAIIIFVLLLLSFFRDNNEKTFTNTENLRDKEKEIMLNDIISEGNDSQDIDKESIKDTLNIQVNISDEVLNFFGGDKKRLAKEMIDFMIDNDLSLDATQVNCTNIVTINFKKNSATTEFELNNPASTIITVDYDDELFYFNFR